MRFVCEDSYAFVFQETGGSRWAADLTEAPRTRRFDRYCHTIHHVRGFRLMRGDGSRGNPQLQE